MSFLARSLIMIAGRGAAKRFDAATRNPRSTQERKLLSILERNKDTEYGRKHVELALIVAVIVIPVGIAVAGWKLDHTIGGLSIGLATALVLLMLVGFEADHAVARHFENRTKPRLDEIARDHGLSRAELTALAIQKLPEQSALRNLRTVAVSPNDDLRLRVLPLREVHDRIERFGQQVPVAHMPLALDELAMLHGEPRLDVPDPMRSNA